MSHRPWPVKTWGKTCLSTLLDRFVFFFRTKILKETVVINPCRDSILIKILPEEDNDEI